MTSPGRAPRSDAEWMLLVEQRFRQLENPTSARIGNWVLTEVDGKLTAQAPGQAPIVIGAATADSALLGTAATPGATPTGGVTPAAPTVDFITELLHMLGIDDDGVLAKIIAAFSGIDLDGDPGAIVAAIIAKLATLDLSDIPLVGDLVDTVMHGMGFAGADFSLTNLSDAFDDFFGSGGTFASLLNNVFDGANGSVGSTGKSLADVLTALQTQFGTLGAANANASTALGGLSTLQAAVTAQASDLITAFEKAVDSFNILGIRTNKPASQGANPTSLSSFTIGHFSAAGSLSTTLAAGTAISQRFTVPESATYGFLEILASGSSLTNIFVNIFKIDPTTNVKTALFNSSNIAASIPSSMSDHTRTLLPGMPATMPGDELLLEIVNGGSNALTLGTKATGAPNNSNEVIQNVGFSRSTSVGGNSPTSLTSGQGSYTGTVPYAVIGIATVPPGYHPPEARSYTVAGSATLVIATEWPWLASGDFIDYGGIGGGGGGGSSLFYATGQGGGSAAWSSGRLVYGTDVKIGSNLVITVGGRGTHVTGQGGTTAGNNGNGNFGGNTTIVYTDPSNTVHTITCTGGQWGAYDASGANSSNSNGQAGQAAGNLTLDGILHTGGASVGGSSTGQSPGGGGGGAISYLEGGDGGVGEIDLYIQQA